MEDGAAKPGVTLEADEGFFSGIYNEIVASPVNLALLAAIGYLLVKILQGWFRKEEPIRMPPPPPPKMKRQDMTVEQLRKYDGNTPDTPICLAVNGKIFNVTKGKRFYGPGGPYEALAGHDASRAFALFQTDSVKEEYDDISDLTPSEMQSVKEWEEQIGDKYDFVGKLLKPGEEPGKYSDDEEEKKEESSSKEGEKKEESSSKEGEKKEESSSKEGEKKEESSSKEDKKND